MEFQFQNAARVHSYEGRIGKYASLAPLRSLFGLFGIQQKNATELQLERGKGHTNRHIHVSSYKLRVLVVSSKASVTFGTHGAHQLDTHILEEENKFGSYNKNDKVW